MKADIIAEYAKAHGLSIVVETGTAYGETADALAAYNHIERVFTVEIDQSRHYDAILRTWNQPKIVCVCGDSANFVKDAAYRLPDAVWFLDAHSVEWEHLGHEAPEPPLLEEIRTVVSRNKRDVLLVDDARLLGEAAGWPTLGEIMAMAGNRYFCEVVEDIVRMVPR